MKILVAIISCIVLIHCADVFSQDSPEGWCPRFVPNGINASAEPQCGFYGTSACPSDQGCCDVYDKVYEPADCFNNSALYSHGVVSLKHGEKLATCGSRCSCNNGEVLCSEDFCLSAGDILNIIATFAIPLTVTLVCMCGCCYCSHKVGSRDRRRQLNTVQREDSPPSYKTALKMPLSISGAISEDGVSPPSYEQAINIA